MLQNDSLLTRSNTQFPKSVLCSTKLHPLAFHSLQYCDQLCYSRRQQCKHQQQSMSDKPTAKVFAVAHTPHVVVAKLNSSFFSVPSHWQKTSYRGISNFSDATKASNTNSHIFTKHNGINFLIVRPCKFSK